MSRREPPEKHEQRSVTRGRRVGLAMGLDSSVQGKLSSLARPPPQHCPLPAVQTPKGQQEEMKVGGVRRCQCPLTPAGLCDGGTHSVGAWQ